MSARVAVLGAGYTGIHLVHRLSGRGDRVAASRRKPLPDPAGLPAALFPFELSDPSSWTALPASDVVVCLLPINVPAVHHLFAALLGERCGRIVVVGTTSSYGAGSGPVDETAPLIRTPRVEGEELLRAQGAVVLRSAGIYGPAAGEHPARNPLEWVRAGRIADGDRYVNLVHVDDLVTAIIGAMDGTRRGEQFLVSDGFPRRWHEITSWARAEGIAGIPELPAGGGGGGRPLAAGRVQNALGIRFRHTDLFAELRILEGR